LKALASSSSQGSNDVLFGRVHAEEVTSLTEKYGVTAVPTFVLLDAAGNMVNRIEGDEDVAAVTQAVQNLMAAPATSTSSNAPAATPTAAQTPEERLTQRLEKLIKSNEVMLFMKGVPGAPRCGFSRQAVELLEEEKIPFGCFDILSDEDVRQGLKKHSNWPTYPQLYAKGELVGGLDILKEMKEEGSLREQLGISSDKVSQPAETLDDRLRKLVNRHKVMLFMKGLPSAPQCGFSRTMVGILDDMGISYDSFNILEDEEVRQGLKKFSDWPTYPQLYANGELIGGLDICKELAESGELDAMLEG
jgi:Grx4 family monothiol glutaredoxin